MKITVNQLRKIIKEEVQRSLRESDDFQYYSPIRIGSAGSGEADLPLDYSMFKELVQNSDPAAYLTTDDGGEVIVMTTDKVFINNLHEYLPNSHEVPGGVATGLKFDDRSDKLISQR